MLVVDHGTHPFVYAKFTDTVNCGAFHGHQSLPLGLRGFAARLMKRALLEAWLYTCGDAAHCLNSDYFRGHI